MFGYGNERQAMPAIKITSSTLLESLVERKCVISPKSVVLASTRSQRIELARWLRRRGHDISVGTHARDLGVDTTLGGKRRVTVQKVRQGKAAARARRINVLARVAPRARHLHTTGMLPQALWGSQVRSIAPTTRKRNRARMAQVAFTKVGGVSGPPRFTRSTDR